MCLIIYKKNTYYSIANRDMDSLDRIRFGSLKQIRCIVIFYIFITVFFYIFFDKNSVENMENESDQNIWIQTPDYRKMSSIK